MFLAILAAVIFRFLFLESSPPGFFVDEAHGGLALLCFAEHGGDYLGRSVSLFSESLNGGNWGPIFLYVGSIWVKAFGGTIVSLRVFQALISLSTIYFIYLIASTLHSKRTGVWCALIGLISPWSIQLGRMHWEAGFLPLLLLAGIYFALVGYQSKYKMAFSGLMFALAAYAYPAGRIHAPLIILVLFFFLLANNKVEFRPWLTMCLASLIAVIPLGILIFSGELMGRGSLVGIYTEHYLSSIGKEQAFLPIAEVFLKNFFKHLSADFLILKGDGILRHHSGFAGQLSALEIFGIALYPIVALRFLYRKKTLKFCDNYSWAPLFLFFCFLICFIPASFTWDSIPHALRSIPGWTFSALLAGISLNYLSEKNKKAFAFFLIIAIGYFSLYTHDYVKDFPNRSAIWFDIGDNQEGRRRANEDDWQPAIDRYANDPNENYLTHMRYWMTAYGNYSCEESQKMFGF